MLNHHSLMSKEGPTDPLPTAVHNKEEHGTASSNSPLQKAVSLIKVTAGVSKLKNGFWVCCLCTMVPLFSLKKNHCNEHPHVAEGNDFLRRAVVTINKLACVKCGTLHWENSKQSLAGFSVFFFFPSNLF